MTSSVCVYYENLYTCVLVCVCVHVVQFVLQVHIMAIDMHSLIGIH